MPIGTPKKATQRLKSGSIRIGSDVSPSRTRRSLGFPKWYASRLNNCPSQVTLKPYLLIGDKLDNSSRNYSPADPRVYSFRPEESLLCSSASTVTLDGACSTETGLDLPGLSVSVCAVALRSIRIAGDDITLAFDFNSPWFRAGFKNPEPGAGYRWITGWAPFPNNF